MPINVNQRVQNGLPNDIKTYVTRFAKTRNNPAFLKTQIFASWCFTYLKPSSVAVSSLYYKIDVELQG